MGSWMPSEIALRCSTVVPAMSSMVMSGMGLPSLWWGRLSGGVGVRPSAGSGGAGTRKQVSSAEVVRYWPMSATSVTVPGSPKVSIASA